LLSKTPLLVLVLLLAGCGFHLQKAFTVPTEMERTYIATEDRHSLFYRELRRQFREAGVQLADIPDDATATLTISVDQTNQRVLSVSTRNVPTEYEVYYSIEYAVDSGDTTLLKRQFITLTRDYTYNETLVLGKAHEEQLLREAIVEDLVRIVFKQLGTL
jgi:LPS-assembly lipoprotein